MKTLNSKTLVGLALLGLLISSNGCMTYTSVHKAQGTPYYNFHGLWITASEPKPAYYAIVPITVPADIVTSPFQGIWYVIQYETMEGLGATP